MDRHYAILTCLLLAALPAAPAMGQTVRLRSDVRVAADEVRLGDVALVTGLPPTACRVVVLELTDAEPAGRVDLGQVELALRRIGINPVPVRFSALAMRSVVSPSAARASARHSASEIVVTLLPICSRRVRSKDSSPRSGISSSGG